MTLSTGSTAMPLRSPAGESSASSLEYVPAGANACDASPRKPDNLAPSAALAEFTFDENKSATSSPVGRCASTDARTNSAEASDIFIAPEYSPTSLSNLFFSASST